MPCTRAAAKRHERLPPIDLTLLAGRCLESGLCELRLSLQLAQRGDKPLARLVAARIVAVRAQLLIQNPRGVLPLRPSLTQILLMGRQQCLPDGRSLVWLPRALPQAPAHRLAVQSQLTRDPRQPPLLLKPQPSDLFPALFADHVCLRNPFDLGCHSQ